MTIRQGSHFLTGCAMMALLLGCESSPPRIGIGRDYNETQKVIIDTTSSIKINDPFFMQLAYQKDFGVNEVEAILYSGTASKHDSVIFTQKLPVNPKASDLLVRGTSGKPLTARGFLRTAKPGSYFIEFRIGPQIVAGKEFSLHNSKE